MKNKFIEYYGQHGISPVKQDITEINKHYARREKLYRQLGIPCIAFEGKRILEVGPGSGYNTLALFFFGGGDLTLVEPNHTGVVEMKKLFSEYNIPPERYVIKECMIEEMLVSEKFDIVIAEGFLHSIDNCDEIINKLSLLVNEGGVIIVTCMDVISMFVEQMKRFVCHIMIKDISDYETQVKKCTGFFHKHMQNLKGMSRSVEDWVRDDILNPAFNNQKILSIGKAIECFGREFSFLGSSQRIFTDYSWYKDIEYDERKNILSQYKQKRHNFLMTGLDETILSECDSEYLEDKIGEIRLRAIEYEKEPSNKYIDQVQEGLYIIKPIMKKISRRCMGFVDEVIEILNYLKRGEEIELERYQIFSESVGRTQQYLSMVKNKVSY